VKGVGVFFAFVVVKFRQFLLPLSISTKSGVYEKDYFYRFDCPYGCDGWHGTGC
jgi:hypothetical protein